MGTLKVPGCVPGVLDELPHQDFPSFPGNMVHDATNFCRKLQGLREAETFAPKHTVSKRRKGTWGSSFSSAFPGASPKFSLVLVCLCITFTFKEEGP